MKWIILLLFVGSALGAVLPLGQIFYPTLGVAHPSQRYVVYDVPQVNTAVRTVPTAVFSNGRPAIAHLPATTYNYYGPPIYDFRFPFNPISPGGLIPSSPGLVPRPPIPQSPNKPANDDNDDDDGIEKLDEKVEPGYDPLGEAASAAADSEELNSETDSVSIEAAV